MLLLFYLMTGRRRHSVLHKFEHHFAEMPREKLRNLLSPLAKGDRGVTGTLRSHHAQLLKLALLCCALAAKRGAGSATETLSLSRAPFPTPNLLKKTLIWGCLGLHSGAA